MKFLSALLVFFSIQQSFATSDCSQHAIQTVQAYVKFVEKVQLSKHTEFKSFFAGVKHDTDLAMPISRYHVYVDYGNNASASYLVLVDQAIMKGKAVCQIYGVKLISEE